MQFERNKTVYNQRNQKNIYRHTILKLIGMNGWIYQVPNIQRMMSFPSIVKFGLQGEEEEEQQRTGLGGRLTAPVHEIRRRHRQVPVNQGVAIDQLRLKQMELADEQLKLQKILLENAVIAQEEAKERVKLVTIQRKIAEIDLRLKEDERNAPNE